MKLCHMKIKTYKPFDKPLQLFSKYSHKSMVSLQTFIKSIKNIKKKLKLNRKPLLSLAYIFHLMENQQVVNSSFDSKKENSKIYKKSLKDFFISF